MYNLSYYIAVISVVLLVVMLSFEELCMALSHLLENRGTTSQDVRSLAEYLLNFFGYTDRVIDNILLPEDRDIFYMLEEIGVLSVETFEIDVMAGKQWHIHYWVLRKKRIKELVEKLMMEKNKKEKEKEEESIYSKISDDVWKSTGPPPAGDAG